MKHIIIILLLFCCLSGVAQKSLKKAHKAYDKFEYYDAIDHYTKYLDKNNDTQASLRLADCYLYTNQYEKAASIFAVVERELDSYSDQRLRYGKVLLVLGRVEEAKVQAEKYLKKNKAEPSGLLLLKSCNLMSQFLSKESNYDINEMLASSGTSNFSPIYYGDRIVYTTDQGGKVDKWTGRSYSNMYEYDPVTKSSLPLPGNLNGKYHNGVVSFIDETRMIYTRNSEKKNKNNDYNLLLAEAKLKNGNWEFDRYFDFNQEESYNVAYPAVSADGEVLIFASDMDGGSGGWDLYQCERSGNSWASPQNLTSINTAGNEMFPNISGEVLTFSSDGYPGMGGLDIFSTNVNSLDNAVNVGAPFNSHRDDFGLITRDGMKSGYYCSNRNDSNGLDHIYRFDKNAESLLMTGIVLDEFTSIPLKETTVTGFRSIWSGRCQCQ